METKLKKKGIEEVRDELKIDNVVCVDRTGMGGGLALLWDSEWGVKLKTLSKSHIDVIVTEKDGVSWILTGIYGHPEKLKHIKAWNLKRLLHQQVTLPWICIGDFNEILSANEKQGGGPRSEWKMANFQEMLDDCRLRDMGFKGAHFTWCNRRDQVYIRLDRGVANQEWYDLFPQFEVHHLSFANSDHMATGVRLRRQSQLQIGMYKK